MDVIPGPKRPFFAHAEVPYLCGEEPFPLIEDYNKKRHDGAWSNPALSVTRLLGRHPGGSQNASRLGQGESSGGGGSLTYLDERARAKDTTVPSYYDLHPQKGRESAFAPAVATNRTLMPSVAPYQVPTADNTVVVESMLKYVAGSSTSHKLIPATDPFHKKGFDCKEFASLPVRRGWKANALQADWDSPAYLAFYHEKGPKETVTLLQAWLFFGVLSEMLGFHVDPENFVTKNEYGRSIISLQRLIGNSQWASCCDSLTAEDHQRIRRIVGCLQQASKFTRLEDTGQLAFLPFVSELAMSVRVIGILFTDICLERDAKMFPAWMRDAEGCRTWGMGKLIQDRMVGRAYAAELPRGCDYETWYGMLTTIAHSSDWCANDVERLKRYLPATAMYFISTISRLSNCFIGRPINTKGKLHSACSGDGCLVNVVDEAHYVNEHFDFCHGHCDMIGPSQDQVRSILQKGGIPLIRFRNDAPSEGLFTNIKDDESTLSFQQIMGQTKSHQSKQVLPNTNFAIQGYKDIDPKTVNRFDSEFEVVEYEPNIDYVALSHVWTDGLGNVSGNTLPSCRMHFIRRALWQTGAPVKMHCPGGYWESVDPEYRDVFGMDQDYPYNVHPDEWAPLVRQKIPAFWLDTFCVPRNSDGTVKKNALARMGETYRNASKVLVIDNELCGHSMGTPCNGIRIKERSYAEVAAWIIGSSWMRRLWTLSEGLLAKKLLVMTNNGPIDVDNLLEGLRSHENRKDPAGIIQRQLAEGLRRIVHFPRTSSERDRVWIAWNASVTRVASKEGDESLCLAGAIGLDVTGLYSAQPEQRPKIFYSLLSTIPESILFSGGEKLTDDGYRWADARLAKTQFDLYSPWGRVQSDPEGLVVSFCWYCATIGWDELSEGTVYIYDADLDMWLKFVSSSTELGSRPALDDLIVLILEDRDLRRSAGYFTQATKAALASFVSATVNPISGTVVRLEGFGFLSRVESGSPEVETAIQLYHERHVVTELEHKPGVHMSNPIARDSIGRARYNSVTAHSRDHGIISRSHLPLLVT